jgi:hypothetical protein
VREPSCFTETESASITGTAANALAEIKKAIAVVFIE